MNTSSIRLYQVDAFSATPFGGNPAAVCLVPAPRPAEWMQRVAREMNLSETAFVSPEDDGFVLRWFTPEVEVDLCGHATLAAAHVLWETGTLPADTDALFRTASGVLKASKDGSWIELDFPALPDQAIPPPPGLAEALGATPQYVGQSRFDLLVEVSDEQQLRELAPDFTMVARLPARGIIVTSKAEAPDYDFASRFFGPAVGIDEDPVTGSAHCCLGPYWTKRLGKKQFLARQVSPRGGDVRVRTNGDRVCLAGQAVTVLKGQFLADS